MSCYSDQAWDRSNLRKAVYFGCQWRGYYCQGREVKGQKNYVHAVGACAVCSLLQLGGVRKQRDQAGS